jgi:hypothetical protein
MLLVCSGMGIGAVGKLARLGQVNRDGKEKKSLDLVQVSFSAQICTSRLGIGEGLI